MSTLLSLLSLLFVFYQIGASGLPTGQLVALGIVTLAVFIAAANVHD